MNEDLIKEVKALANEVHANETKEAQLREQLAQTCVNNYNQCVCPMLEQQTAVLDAISEVVQDKLHLGTFKKQVLVAGIKYDVFIYCPYCASNTLAFKIEHSCDYETIVSCMHEADVSKSLWYANAVVLSHFFGNEDAIQMTCGFINDMLAEQLFTIKNKCTDKNERLKNLIDELTLRLSVAHVPISKEDGTVEVMIGGKKFIGKLEEDTNGHTNY